MTDELDYTGRHRHGVEQLSPVEEAANGWWPRYAASLADSLTPVARTVVEAD